MRLPRALVLVRASALAFVLVRSAHAADPPAPSDAPTHTDGPAATPPTATLPATIPTTEPANANAPAPAHEGGGFAVLAVGPSLQATWPLAKALYARSALRPAAVDDAHARVLAGEPASSDAPKDIRDLAETRAAIRGDDAPSRQLLAALATTLHLRGIVIVEMIQAAPTARARVFLPESGFDAADYRPDDGAPPIAWSAAVRSIERSFTPLPATTHPAPAEALRQVPPVEPLHAVGASARTGTDTKSEEHRPFYTSPWFWGAVGAAVFAGGAVYLATRDNTPSTIHLQVQVPK